MYIRVTRARFSPPTYDEVSPFFEQLAEVLKNLPGFQSYYQGVDRSEGGLIAVSTWDDEENAAFDRAVLREVLTRMQAAGVQLEAPEVYEVAYKA